MIFFFLLSLMLCEDRWCGRIPLCVLLMIFMLGDCKKIYKDAWCMKYHVVNSGLEERC